MALSPFQLEVCRLLGAARGAQGESYVGGGVALNVLLNAPRFSRDVDLFHDSEEALRVTWRSDLELLERSGYTSRTITERPAFVEVVVARDGESVSLQWVQDSAWRFFPLIEHPLLGLTLHPFDAATNKVLALVGRIEPRDWVDTLTCHEQLQPFGFLAFAACGKDEGWTPAMILDHAARSVRFSPDRLAQLFFDGVAPDPLALGQKWRAMLAGAREIIEILPPEEVGKCVVTNAGTLCNFAPSALESALQANEIRFHEGHLCGAWPQIVPRRDF